MATAAELVAVPDAGRDEAEVCLFKEFLRINTMHPNPDLAKCVAWLRERAAELSMTVEVVEFKEGLPIVILTKKGADPSLKSVVLNCHMDVVPVMAEKWTALPKGETPFSAWESADGKIYARGSQDMKCVGAQYLCALRRLAGRTFQRTIHTVWVPDEEIGGTNGMALFVHSEAFRRLNVGCTLDEGLAHDENTWVVFYGERTPVWVGFAATGPPGHAAKLIEDTAMDRLSRVIEHFSKRRDASVAKLKADPGLLPGDVTTINFTMCHAGVTNDGGKTYAYNVIPPTGRVVFDCRVTFEDYPKLMGEVDKLAKELNLTVEFPVGKPDGPSQLSSIGTVWYKTIADRLARWGANVQPAVFPAATDSRYVRKVGVPAFGFSPMRNVPSLLHDHNEYLSRAAFLEGVAVYADLIPHIADLPAAADTTAAKL